MILPSDLISIDHFVKDIKQLYVNGSHDVNGTKFRIEKYIWINREN